jgi:hypothetical protein
LLYKRGVTNAVWKGVKYPKLFVHCNKHLKIPGRIWPNDGQGGEGEEGRGGNLGWKEGEKKWGGGGGGFLCISSSSLISLSARFSPKIV